MPEPLFTAPQIAQLIQALEEHLRMFLPVQELLDKNAEGALLSAFEALLTDLDDQGTFPTQACHRLAEVHFGNRLPFAVMMGSFNLLKTQALGGPMPPQGSRLDHFLTLDRAFEGAKRESARQFLILEATTGNGLPELLIREKTLIRLCLEWLEEVRAAIRDDLDRFPLQSAGDTAFARALAYPESLLICLDLKLCDQLYQQHRLIVQQASLLYAMLAAERFEQACVAYQEVVKKVAELLNLLSVLYFEEQTNRVHRFFNFLQASLYLPAEKYLCVINVRRLGKINRLYGWETGDRLLAAVDQALQQEFRRHQQWLYYIRGVAGDFYLVGLDTTSRALERLCARVEKRLAQASDDLPVPIELHYHGIELSQLNELTRENMHLLVSYLSHRRAEEGDTIETGRRPSQRLLGWLKEHYHRSIELRDKLTPEATDIFIQPLVAIEDQGRIHAFEVLGRFRDGKGYLNAGMFIDDIVLMGLATEFDLLVLQAIERHAQSLESFTERLFVNVSAGSLESADYIQALTRALAGPLAKLEVVLELTEQVLLEKRALIHQLHERHGLRFAIDDFGIGYSNLQTVIELALGGSIGYLKLDGSLTRDLTRNRASERIMQITQQRANELGLATVAEFVETRAQAHRLTALGMDYGQGFLFGIPDPVEVWKGKMNYLRSRQEQPGALVL